MEHDMELKIRNRDLQVLREAVTAEDTCERRSAYCSGNFAWSDKCKDWDMRYRWDLLRASRIRLGGGALAKGDLNLYGYMNDRSIDDVLRVIVPPLGKSAEPRPNSPM